MPIIRDSGRPGDDEEIEVTTDQARELQALDMVHARCRLCSGGLVGDVHHRRSTVAWHEIEGIVRPAIER